MVQKVKYDKNRDDSLLFSRAQLTSEYQNKQTNKTPTPVRLMKLTDKLVTMTRPQSLGKTDTL